MATGLRSVAVAGALDRLRLVADRDRDLAGLVLLGLRDLDLEHAVVEVRLDALGADALGERQRPREAPEATLDAVVAVLALLVLGLALAGDPQDVVVELDVDVALAQSGQVCLEDVLVRRSR